MSNIIEVLILIILGLLGINAYQGKRTKTLKEEAQLAKADVKQKEKEIEKLHETKQKIVEVEKKPEPKKVAPPSPGDVDDRLNRLNKLHDNHSGKTK